MNDETDYFCPSNRLSEAQQAALEMHRRVGLEQEDGPVGAEEALREEYRETAREAMAEFRERFITPLIEMKALQIDCLIFVNGFGHLITCSCQKDIVERHKEAPNAKANVSKYVQQYRRRLGLPALNGQRDEAACQSMREARRKQLTQPAIP